MDRLHPARFREVSLPRLPTRGRSWAEITLLARSRVVSSNLGEKAQVQVLLSLDDQGRQTGEIR